MLDFVALGQGRYKWRHNQVLRALLAGVKKEVLRAKEDCSIIRESMVSVKERWQTGCVVQSAWRRMLPASLKLVSGLRPDLVLSESQGAGDC